MAKSKKVYTDVCGCCFQVFKDKDAQASADKLKAHIEVCPQYTLLRALKTKKEGTIY